MVVRILIPGDTLETGVGLADMWTHARADIPDMFGSMDPNKDIEEAIYSIIA